jgi:transcriptional regulator with GAF, ATPase, and Fis domain
LKFFINSNTKAYLRSLEEEFKESTNSIRIELNRLEQANMLNSSISGNKKIYQANTKHPLFYDLQKIVMKHVGIDEIIKNVAKNLGFLERVYLTGSFVKGMDSKEIELVFVGQIDEQYLQTIIAKSEALIKRKIKTHVVPAAQLAQNNFEDNQQFLLCWTNE